MSICTYASGAEISATDPGPTDRGNNLFAGGVSAVARISQTIDVSSAASQIDAGTLPFTLSGWLGGWNGQDDNALLRATFKDAAGATLGTSSVGPVLSADRNGATALVFKTTSGTVPARTRKVEVVLEITRTSGSYNDGLADNLSLVLGTAGSTGGGTGGGGTGGGTGSSAVYSNQMMTRALPSTCSDTTLPTPTTSFLTTDKQAYMFFMVTLKVGDVLATEWTAPNGDIVDPTGAYRPVTSAATYCIGSEERLPIAGSANANRTGSWRARAYLNGTLLFTLTFTIDAPATTGGLTAKINQVITSACPKITVVATVTDSSGKPVTGLNSSNFTLKEDGTTQTTSVTSTGTGGGTAMSLALVIDHSGSVSGQPLTDEKAAAKALVAQLGASDAVAVLGFGSAVESVLDFTTNKTSINSAIDGVGGGGNTALYKAVVAAAQKLAPRSGRKAIVLMTDGEDTVGGSSIQDAINQAKLAGAPIFPVGFGSVDTAVLTRLATETGGTYTPAASSSSLVNILQNIGAVIAAQYEISYTSSSPSSSHTLELTAQSGSNRSAAVTQSVTACQASGPAVILKVENTTAAPGASVDVPVTLTATTAPSGFQYDLGYDSSKLTFVQAKQGDQTKAASKDISTNALSSSSLRVLAAGLNQGLIANGTVVLMNFRLNSGFSSGTASLTCSNAQSTDANSRAITPTTCQSGTLTVRAACSCDVNGDGTTNVSDVQLIVNQALGIVSNRCDINADGQTNVLDVQMVVNATLGLGCR